MDEKLWSEIVNLRNILIKQKDNDEKEKLKLYEKIHEYIKHLQTTKKVQENEMKEILRLEKELEKLLLGRNQNDKSVSEISSITSEITSEVNATVVCVDNVESMPIISSLNESTQQATPSSKKTDKSDDQLINGNIKENAMNMFDSKEQLIQVYEARLDQLKIELARCKRILFTKYCDKCGVGHFDEKNRKIENKNPITSNVHDSLNETASLKPSQVKAMKTSEVNSAPPAKSLDNLNKTVGVKPSQVKAMKTPEVNSAPPAKSLGKSNETARVPSKIKATKTPEVNSAPSGKSLDNLNKTVSVKPSQIKATKTPEVNSAPPAKSLGKSNETVSVKPSQIKTTKTPEVNSAPPIKTNKSVEKPNTSKEKPSQNERNSSAKIDKKVAVKEDSEVESITTDSTSTEIDRLFGKTLRQISNPIPALPVHGIQNKVDKSKRKLAVQTKINQKIVTDDDSLSSWNNILKQFGDDNNDDAKTAKFFTNKGKEKLLAKLENKRKK